jgi:hypothetical protein
MGKLNNRSRSRIRNNSRSNRSGGAAPQATPQAGGAPGSIASSPLIPPLNLKTLLLNSRNAICDLELPLELEYLKITRNHKYNCDFYLINQIEYFGVFL